MKLRSHVRNRIRTVLAARGSTCENNYRYSGFIRLYLLFFFCIGHTICWSGGAGTDHSRRMSSCQSVIEDQAEFFRRNLFNFRAVLCCPTHEWCEILGMCLDDSVALRLGRSCSHPSSPQHRMFYSPLLRVHGEQLCASATRFWPWRSVGGYKCVSTLSRRTESSSSCSRGCRHSLTASPFQDAAARASEGGNLRFWGPRGQRIHTTPFLVAALLRGACLVYCFGGMLCCAPVSTTSSFYCKPASRLTSFVVGVPPSSSLFNDAVRSLAPL